jgi:phasin family protein
MATDKKFEFPFMGADFAKLMNPDLSAFMTPDFAKLMSPDVTKMFGGDMMARMADFKVPGVDLGAMMAFGRRNFEALTEANRVAAEGYQAVARRQAEILRDTAAELQGALQEMTSVHGVEGIPQRQVEVARRAFESAIANRRELAEMTSRANGEVFEVLNKRITESIEEIKALGPKL